MPPVRRLRRSARAARELAVLIAFAGVLSIVNVPTSSAAPAKPHSTIVTWGAAAEQLGTAGSDLTYRLAIHISGGGTGLRIRLSNAFGDQPVTFGRVYAGTRGTGAEVLAGSNHQLTFDGAAAVEVAPGGSVYSDPIPGTVPDQADLAVSVYVQRASGAATGHGMALQTSYYTAGDHATEEGAGAFVQQTESWFYLDAVTVDAKPGTGSVVAFGDSITDGWNSSSNKNRRWPDYLARRLLADPNSSLKGVANEGISGNRLLQDGAAQAGVRRLERDVFSQQGVRTLILLEGVNDIKFTPAPTEEQLLAGYREVISRSHAAGICVIGATVLPFKGWGEWTPGAEKLRQAVNTFIRESGEFDGFVDLDKVIRSPYDHERVFPQFDNGDHLHLNDKGMARMADSIDLAALHCDR